MKNPGAYWIIESIARQYGVHHNVALQWIKEIAETYQPRAHTVYASDCTVTNTTNGSSGFGSIGHG